MYQQLKELEKYINYREYEKAFKLAQSKPELLFEDLVFGHSNTTICIVISHQDYSFALDLAKIDPSALNAQCYYETTVLEYAIIYSHLNSWSDIFIEMAQLDKENISGKIISLLIHKNMLDMALQLAQHHPPALKQESKYSNNQNPISYAEDNGYSELAAAMQKIDMPTIIDSEFEL